MAERRLVRAIKAGLQEYIDDPWLLEAWALKMLELDQDEIDELRLYFAGGTDAAGETHEARPPIVVHGYPRRSGPFPCWALTLGNESIEQDYLGKDAPFLDSDGEKSFDQYGNVVDPRIRRLGYTYPIMVITDHPDITVIYYHLLKNIIMSSQDALEKDDVEDLAFTGQDMAPDPRFLPEDVFVRLLIVTVSGDETWCSPREQPYSNQVGGLHTDDTGEGATEGDGSTSASITPTTGS